MKSKRIATSEMLVTKVDEAWEVLAELRKELTKPSGQHAQRSRIPAFEAGTGPFLDLEDLDKVERLFAEIKRTLRRT